MGNFETSGPAEKECAWSSPSSWPWNKDGCPGLATLDLGGGRRDVEKVLVAHALFRGAYAPSYTFSRTCNNAAQTPLPDLSSPLLLDFSPGICCSRNAERRRNCEQGLTCAGARNRKNRSELSQVQSLRVVES